MSPLDFTAGRLAALQQMRAVVTRMEADYMSRTDEDRLRHAIAAVVCRGLAKAMATMEWNIARGRFQSGNTVVTRAPLASDDGLPSTL